MATKKESIPPGTPREIALLDCLAAIQATIDQMFAKHPQIAELRDQIAAVDDLLERKKRKPAKKVK
ncbi:MAG: hypothetical protein U1F10_00550 [Burkholderiales bacterium]